MLHHRPESTAAGGVFSADADDLVAPPPPLEVASVGRKSAFPAGAPDMEVARVAALKISGRPKNAPAPPVIAGTAAGQNTYDTASLKPFSAVTITDSNAGTQTETVTVSPSTTANGTLTDPNAGSDGGTVLNGTFTISGTASQVTAALDALVFTPVGGEVFTGTAVTTGFTIKVTDTAGGTATDSTTTVIATATAPFTDLASFNPAVSDGTDPVGGLIADANGDLFGTTSYGAGQGVYELIKTANGYAATPTVLLGLGPSTGYQSQAGLIADANGDLFGTAYYSGQYGYGTVFEIAKTANGYATTPIILANFNGGSTGAYPLAGLTFDSSGDLFGTTQLGGSANDGAVFEIVKTANGYASTPTILLNFGSVAAGSNANQPDGGLFVDAAGNIFGTTLDGGTGNLGTLWELAKTAGGYAAAPTILINFNGNNGGDPRAGLIEDANGDLFGTTSFGGSGGEGTVFELVKTAGGYASAPTVLVNFAGANGYDPQAGLIADASGNLFGTTVRGGTYNDGTVFEVVKTAGGYASTPVILLSFDGADGANPVAGLTPSASGTLYGTTEIGGANNSGAIFAVNAGFAVAKPVIAGTVGGQTTTSEAPVQVFSGVTLTDANSFGGGVDTLTITYAGGGTLSGSNLLTGLAGSYSLTGTAAALTAALDALIFTPSAGGPGSQVTTVLTLTDTNTTFATQATDSTTTLTDVDPGGAPSFAVSGVTAFGTTAETPVKPFAGVTITDPNVAGSTDTLTITLSGGGTLTGTGLTSSNGTYTLTGAAAAITAELQSLVFTPVDGVPNTAVTTGFKLSDKSSAFATATVNTAITVTDTDTAVAPSISVSGTTSFATTSEATVKPFAGVTIADLNNGGADTDTLTITLSGGGSLTGTGLSGANGTYTLTGSAAAITSELQDLVFGPVDGVPNTAVTTGFTLSDKSSASSTAAVNTAITVTDTDPSVAPSISVTGTTSFPTTSEATVKPFAGVSISDLNNGGTDTDTLTITLSGGGTLTGSGLTGSGGTYTLTGTASVITSELQNLVFHPVDGVPNTAVTSGFSLSDKSSASPTAAVNTAISVTDTDPSVAPSMTVTGTTSFATTSEATVKPFAGVTVADLNNGGSDTLTITLSGGGTLTGTGLTGANGTYTLTGTAAGITSALQNLVFIPVDGVANTSVTTGFTLSDRSSASSTAAVTTAITVTDTDPALAPGISVTGTTSFATTSEATVKPFVGVTISDLNNGGADSDTLTITLSGSGSLTGIGLSGANGTYTLTGSAASITNELQSLVFHPVDGVPNTAVTTGFTLSDKSSASSTAAINTAIIVTDTDPAVAPTIATSGSTTLTTTSESAISPFAGVTVTDLNNGGSGTDTLTIIQSGSGTLTGTGLAGTNGTYTLAGTAAAITAALEALVFHATDGVPNTSVTTTFSLTDRNGATATSSGTATLSVTDTDPPVAPTISATGTTSFATTSEAPVRPFEGVTIADTNSGGTDTLTITLSGAGTLTGTGLSSSNGTYTLTGTAASITSEVQALLFTPAFGQANSSATTTFTLTDRSSAGASLATNSAITVTDTDPAAVSVISGAVGGQTTTDEQTIRPFAMVTITDPNAGTQQDSMVITVSGGTADGTLSGTGLVYLGGGNYELSPVSPATLQAELEALVFTPTAHQVTPGSTVTTTFGLIVVNENSLVSSTNSTTTVIATAVNDSPTISGAASGQTLLDNATDKPFAAVTITDPDLSVTDSLTITLKNGAGTVTDADGTLSGTGLTKTGTGTYVLAAASPATLTSELEALVFTPTAHQVNAGASVITGFTLVASQTAGGSTVTTTNTSTSVTVTAVGIAPTISITGSTTLTDSFDAAVKPFAGVSIGDLNDGGGDTDTFVITESGLAGALSGTGLTGANGTYTLTGSVATINTELQGLSFTPSASVLPANTVFGLSLSSSGYGTATVHSNAITVTSSSLIAASGAYMPAAMAHPTELPLPGLVLTDFLATHADLPHSHALLTGHSIAGFDIVGSDDYATLGDGHAPLSTGAFASATPFDLAGFALGQFLAHVPIAL